MIYVLYKKEHRSDLGREPYFEILGVGFNDLELRGAHADEEWERSSNFFGMPSWSWSPYPDTTYIIEGFEPGDLASWQYIRDM